jgi:hypothetical protein
MRTVTPTTLSAVRGQKAYMLFYVKRTMAYVQSGPRPSTDPQTNGVNGNGSVNGH